MLFNVFGLTFRYNESCESSHHTDYYHDDVNVYHFSYKPLIFFSSREPEAHHFSKYNSMALKKKKNLSDRVVEFVLNCSIEDFQNLTVTKIASAFQVNRCYLSRRFKSEKDFTLCEFLMREKLSRSIILLRQDNRITIQELSTKMGFSNANYFIQIFKSYFGAPPGRYRDCISKGMSNK